jgi:integrase
VRSSDVDDLYRKLIRDSVSPRTRRKVHDLLSGVFTLAIEKRRIVSDPMLGIKRPAYDAPAVKALSPKQIEAFLTAAQDDPLEPLYLLALFGGLRSGEALALCWGEVDVKRGIVYVRSSLQDTGARVKEGEGPSRVVAATKTKKSARPVALPKIAADSLRRHHKKAADPAAGDLVFPNERGKPLWRQNVLRLSFYPLLERAGLYDGQGRTSAHVPRPTARPRYRTLPRRCSPEDRSRAPGALADRDHVRHLLVERAESPNCCGPGDGCRFPIAAPSSANTTRDTTRPK